jgi:hypothetical protein
MLRALYLILLVFLDVSVRAETNETLVADYMPFLNGQAWPRVSVISFAETSSNTWVHPSDPKHFPTIQEVYETNSDFTTVVIRFPDGREYRTYNDFVLGPYLSAVYMGDFNNDGIPDFMAVKPGSGCGLAGEYCTGIFAFSDGSDYQFRRITTMGLGPQNLVLDPKTKSFRLIHTSFRESQTLDGQIHSFWVHRFYKWEYSSFRSDADLPPIWVQYLYRPNHEATKLLTPDLKAKAWADDPESDQIEW